MQIDVILAMWKSFHYYLFKMVAFSLLQNSATTVDTFKIFGNGKNVRNEKLWQNRVAFYLKYCIILRNTFFQKEYHYEIHYAI